MHRKKIRILIDVNPVVQSNRSGVGYYTLGLVQAIADLYPDDVELIGHYFSFLGKKDRMNLPSAANIKYKRSRIIPEKILSITRRFGFQLPIELLFKGRGDYALFTNFVSLPSLTNIPTIVAVHDLCFEEIPDYVAEKNRNFLKCFVPKSIEKSWRVITISDSTKQAIQKHYAIDNKKIIVTPIPPPVDLPKGNKALLKELGVEKDYLLFVSTLEPRKNVIQLVEAYVQLPPSIRDTHQLVLAGAPGWYMEDTMSRIKELQDQGLGIILAGYVSDETRAALYAHTKLFVFPSHYEGFGMPILEAMSYKVPTAISDIPVFHEVAGNASIYFDKDSPDSIAQAITKVLSDQQLAKRLVANGQRNLQRYSWEDVAKIVYDSLREAK